MVFNRDRILETVGGDSDILQEIVDVFLEDTPRRLEMLQQHLNAGDLDAIRLQAHAIKGAAGNVGAERLCRLASHLEQQALAKVVTDLNANLGELTAAFEAFQQHSGDFRN